MVVRCQCIAAPRALRTVRQLYFRKMIVYFTFIASSKFICYTVSKHFTKEVHILQSDYLQWWALKTQHQLKVSLFLGYPLPLCTIQYTVFPILEKWAILLHHHFTGVFKCTPEAVLTILSTYVYNFTPFK